ncbi:uncharacterized protein CTRU02_209838 [Colletotrichum truncatum]|uniref:Uncharacterized protein n=1 Tax=Colletotrichum truncatum TaxID=5467 RepID=A0ACC3YTP7_COLTU|nr:uncharacterized protein CTRU02_02410 [Colletotrichum truncatum]KAF6798436.1 hypothetical protein CTRU02_02410 [Colletotrichum truncatum]
MHLQDHRKQQSRLQDAASHSIGLSKSSSTLSCEDSSLYIHVAMSDQHYMDRTSVHSDGYTDPVSGRCSPCAQPPTTTYPDLTSPPYSITTFNQNQQGEPHLLTPVSGVGSPSMQQNAKMMQQQHPATTASMYQQPSPSTTSRMCWPNSFDMGAPHSQAASPLPMNPSTTESHFEMNYISAETPIKDEIPEPPVPYFGAYGVSGQQDSDQGSLSPPMHSAFYMPTDGSMLNTTSLLPTPDLTMAHQSMGRTLAPANQMPFNAQPHVYQPQTGGLSDRDDITRRPSYPWAFPSTQVTRPSSSDSSPRSRQPRVKREPRMRNRCDEASTKAAATRLVHQSPQVKSSEQGEPQLIIKSTCPPEERFLFQRRFELEEQKGGGIWGTIQEEFNQNFQQHSDIPRLQMMVTRGRPQYLEWPQTDDEILRESMRFVEQQYWKMTYQKFKELGGGSAAHWGLADIEHRAVEKGWANIYYEPSPVDQSMNIRRRKKLNTRRRSAVMDGMPFETVHLSEDQREQLVDDIIVERDIKPEDEDEEATRNDLQHMRLAHVRGPPAIKQEEGLVGNGGRVAKSQKPSVAKTKNRSRAQRTKAA